MWAASLLGILIVAAIEGIILQQSGFEFRPRSAIRSARGHDLSIDAHGLWAVALVDLCTNDLESPPWSDVALIDLTQREVHLLEQHELRPQSVTISADGKSVAVAGNDGSIYLLPGPCRENSGQDPQPIQLFVREVDRVFAKLQFAPDGRFLAAVDRNDVSIWEWPDGKLIRRFRHLGGLRQILAFSPDSQCIITAMSDGGVCLRHIASDEIQQTVEPIGSPILDAALTADSQRLAVSSLGPFGVFSVEGDYVLWWDKVAMPVMALDSNRNQVAAVVPHRDAFGISIRNAENGNLQHLLDVDAILITHMVFSPDGTLLAIDGNGTLHAWDPDDPQANWSLSIADCVLHEAVRH